MDNLDTTKARVEAVLECKDWEDRHLQEDNLLHEFVYMVAEGCEDPQEFARILVQMLEQTPVDRWYA